MKVNNLSGQRFGSKVVLDICGRSSCGHSKWRVQCDCGNIFTTTAQSLKETTYCRRCNPKLKEPRPYRSELPYTMDNIVVCCKRCNIGKNIYFTYEEWRQVGEVIKTWRTDSAIS